MKKYYMPDYIGGGDPDTPKSPKGTLSGSAGYFPSSSQGADARALDVRDIIASFVNRGDKNLKNEDARKGFAYLSANMGPDAAHKLLNHILIFNQRPDQQQKGFEQRLQSLYDIGSNDADVDALLKKTKALGLGPLAGAKNSSNLGVMSAYGPVTAGVTTVSPLATAMVNRK